MCPYWGPGLQPRHVPWLGIELATLWFIAHAQSTELHQPGLIISYKQMPLITNCKSHNWWIMIGICFDSHLIDFITYFFEIIIFNKFLSFPKYLPTNFCKCIQLHLVIFHIGLRQENGPFTIFKSSLFSCKKYADYPIIFPLEVSLKTNREDWVKIMYCRQFSSFVTKL